MVRLKIKIVIIGIINVIMLLKYVIRCNMW